MLRPFMRRPTQLSWAAASILRTVAAPTTASLRVPSQNTPFKTSRRNRLAITSAIRLYSTEAVEYREEATEDGPPTQFKDLAGLGVHPSLVDTITKKLGFSTMTDVQSKTIKPALDGKDLVAQAKTGTGKTLAFLIPIVQKILTNNPRLRGTRPRADDIEAIIISPTRELAEQISQEARKLVQGQGIQVQLAVGGTQKRDNHNRMQREGCHILVATPGRLADILSDHNARISAPKLHTLVLDEADRMLEIGFQDQLTEIVGMLPKGPETPRQTLLFSATIPHNVVRLAKSMLNASSFEFVQTIDPDETPTVEKVSQRIVTLKGLENLFPAILELTQTAMAAEKEGAPPFKAIVFFNWTSHVKLAAALFHGLRREGARLPWVLDIHSGRTQMQRQMAADSFRTKESAILLSSDVTARGLDFPNVTHVIQVHVPQSRDSYIHRVGRTARAQKTGESWLLIAEDEVSSARQILPGLPIQRDRSLTTAEFDVAALRRGDSQDTDGPEQFEQVLRAGKTVPPELIEDAYFVMLSGSAQWVQSMDKVRRVELANRWTEHVFGLEEPPAMHPAQAKKQGLDRVPGVRIGYPERRPDANDDAWGGSDRGRSGGGGFRRNSFGGDRDRGSFGGRDRGSFGDRRGPRRPRSSFDELNSAPTTRSRGPQRANF